MYVHVHSLNLIVLYLEPAHLLRIDLHTLVVDELLRTVALRCVYNGPSPVNQLMLQYYMYMYNVYNVCYSFI